MSKHNVKTKGRRVQDGTSPDDYLPGDYGIDWLGCQGRPPLHGDEGNIIISFNGMKRVNHRDGTITVEPRIYGTNGIAHWRGRLIRGVWIEDDN